MLESCSVRSLQEGCQVGVGGGSRGDEGTPGGRWRHFLLPRGGGGREAVGGFSYMTP